MSNDNDTLENLPPQGKNEMRRYRIDNDEDYIDSGRHHYSLEKFIADNPNGASDASICRFLLLSPEELESMYKLALRRLKQMITD